MRRTDRWHIAGALVFLLVLAAVMTSKCAAIRECQRDGHSMVYCVNLFSR